MQSTGSLRQCGIHHVSKPCADKVCRQGCITPISFPGNIVNQPPVSCATEQKGKAAYEDAEMDPEIQHLIETLFWEIDICPPNLIGDITLQVNKTEKARPPPKKLQRVYKIEDMC